MTIALPAALIGLHAMLALVAATVLRKPWMRYFALVCASVEIAALAVLIVAVR